MKLIIWWLALMSVLPLAFLFWWKKNWRLLIGVIIGAVLLISFFLPGEITYSIIKNKLDKESNKPLQKLASSLENIADFIPNSSDPEKLKLEKRIKFLREQSEELIKKLHRKENLTDEEKLIYHFCQELPSLERRWIKEYGGEENPQPLLFCNEEFNKGLSRENLHLEHHTIDFSDGKNNKLESLKERLQQIHEQGEDEIKIYPYCFLVWLKNIDKITNSEVKNELLKIVDFTKNSDLGKYEKEEKNGQETVRIKKTIDFSKFILVATTSSSSPQLSSELSQKMNHIEHFFDKHFLVIFLVSGGLEMITFYFLTRARKKQKQTK